MSKTNRGKGLMDRINRGRKTCPVCKRTGIKAVYEVELNEKKYEVCKQCKSAVAKGKKEEAVAALS